MGGEASGASGARRRQGPRPGRAAPIGTAAPGARATALGAAFLLLAQAGCAGPRGSAEAPTVTRFDLPGVRSVDQDVLRSRLATQEPDCWPLGTLCDWTALDPDALAGDRQRIEAFYRASGYYKASAERPVVAPDGEGRAKVKVMVAEGSPVHVRKIQVDGLEVAPEARPGRLPLQQGAIFAEADYDASRVAIEAALRNHGYAEAAVTAHAQVVPEEGWADVTYTVTPGPRFRVGAISVAGTAAVSSGLLAGQAERELRPGDWWDESKLAKVQARVLELAAFAGVRVSRGAPDVASATVPVIVTVREAPFRTVKFGPGLGFQATRWDAQGQASWTDRNFYGDLRRVKAELHAGYAWLPDPIKVQREDVVGKLDLEFSQPAAIARAIDLLAQLALERSLEPAYGFWSERLRLGTPLRLAPRWTVVPSFNLDVYQLHDLVGETTSLPQFSSCPGRICLLAYVEERLAWDGRDDPIATRRGFLASLSVQEGFPVGGYGYRYLRVLPEVRLYLPLGKAVLAARGRAGALIPIGESGPAPVVALFTSGGAQTMRGYGAGRLSPMSQQNGAYVPTGGNGLLDGTVELRLPLRGELGGALFLDAGNVSAASGSPTGYQAALDPTALQLAAGVGIRYGTPFGPLRADLAMRLPNDWRPNVNFAHRFPTVPGDSVHRENIVALQVTLGEAF